MITAKYWKDYSAREGYCKFQDGAYHAIAPNNGYKVTCPASSTNFNNFAFQVDMKIIDGDCGGIFFRANPSSNLSQYYYFHVCQNGTYALLRYDKQDSPAQKLVDITSSPFINSGYNQINTLTVVAQTDTMYLYVNGHYINNVKDSLYSNGQIGVVSANGSNLTEVAFSNLKVWEL